MFLKIVGILGLVAVVCGQNHYGAHNDVQHDVVHYHHDEEHHGPAHYEYRYDVHDDHTGDVHGQHEARKDDSTHGEYYLIDADGHKRTVKYHVEGKSGFIAEVHREPIKGFHDAPAHHNFHHKFEEKY
ncbi:larval cuticle protein A2B-like [Anopheles funestus]|uniref:larval cuticle protein A2B-like n=1 Tax=Anopheles funestus TaxID=62324 RepID=UPI0020C70A3B|nr:larval cuticle protein A2B-like [Anopheles funestus]